MEQVKNEKQDFAPIPSMFGVKSSEDAALRFSHETELYTDFYVNAGGQNQKSQNSQNSHIHAQGQRRGDSIIDYDNVNENHHDHDPISNPVLTEAARSLLIWRKNTEASLAEHAMKEKTKYLQALEQAETEMQVRTFR